MIERRSLFLDISYKSINACQQTAIGKQFKMGGAMGTTHPNGSSCASEFDQMEINLTI